MVIILDFDFAEKKIKRILSEIKDKNRIQKCIDFLYENFERYNWIGIYFVKGDYLILGSWKGEKATEHVKIPIGKGICGSAAQSGRTEVVADVLKDNRYLACFVSTRSEIVVPIKKNGRIIGEIDIDSNVVNAFTNKDVIFFEKISDMLSKHIH
jgi:GAF domain-containing protein